MSIATQLYPWITKTAPFFSSTNVICYPHLQSVTPFIRRAVFFLSLVLNVVHKWFLKLWVVPMNFFVSFGHYSRNLHVLIGMDGISGKYINLATAILMINIFVRWITYYVLASESLFFLSFRYFPAAKRVDTTCSCKIMNCVWVFLWAWPYLFLRPKEIVYALI